jgi:hypothetical protein
MVIMYGDVIGRKWPCNSHYYEGTENSEDPVRITDAPAEIRTGYLLHTSQPPEPDMATVGGGGGPRSDITKHAADLLLVHYPSFEGGKVVC